MIAAHITFCIAFVVVVVKARLTAFDNRLVEAAADLGATPLQAFLRIVLPLAAPGIAAGAMLAFTISLDDVVITSFTSGPGFDDPAALHLRPAEVRRVALDQRALDDRAGGRARPADDRRRVQRARAARRGIGAIDVDDARVGAHGTAPQARHRDPGPALARAVGTPRRAPSRRASAPRCRSSCERAQGGIVEDVDGNRLIDLGAGIAVVNVGHAHPAVVERDRASRRRASSTRASR